MLHAEMDCLENAGRLPGARYKRCTLYSTLSCCSMCSGAILLYGIPRVVIGEDVNFQGAADHLKSQGVEVINANDPTCIDLMSNFIIQHPSLWNEDIGVAEHPDK